MPKTFYIKTMGCQMNEYDSDFLARCLMQEDFLPTHIPDHADVILINTCAVREKPEQKAASFLGRMGALKRKKPDLVLGMIGCMAQKEGKDFFKRFPLLDMVVGPRELERIPRILEQIFSEREKVVATDLTSLPPKSIPSKGYFKGRVSGFISIMEGCNNFCTYCIVPYVRGREVSRSPKDILNDAKELISDGVKDITLLGQNVLSYQWNSHDIVFLLKQLNQLDGLQRLRFTTSHPKDLSMGIIQSFSDVEKLCPHIHLPFQSGSNAILKKMKRGYSREHYLELVSRLRDSQPEIAITSDVMVGFPGEDEEDFQMTLDLIRRVEFDGLFSFIYSDRKGTIADRMPQKIDYSIKSKRLETLQELQKQITLEKNRVLKGRSMEVLVEGKDKKGGRLTGRTRTNKIVNFSCNNSAIGDLVNVMIKKCFVNSLQA